MPKLIRCAAAATASAIVVCAAPAAWAHGKPTGHQGHGGSHAIASRLAHVSRLAAAAGTSRALTVADRAGLTVALAGDLAAIRADAAALRDADRATRKAAVAAAVNTARIARTQFRGVVAADRIAARAVALTAAVITMSAQATGPADAALADARTRLAAASRHAHDACATQLGLTPTANRGEQRAARAATHVALHAARRDESAAVADLAQASMSLGG